MSLKVIFIAIMALLAVAQVRAVAPTAVTLSQLSYDGIGYKIHPTAANAVTTVTVTFLWATYTDATICITSATLAAIPTGCNLDMKVYVGTAAWTYATAWLSSTTQCSVTGGVVTCVGTVASTATANTDGAISAAIFGYPAKATPTATVVGQWQGMTSFDNTLKDSAAALTAVTMTATGTLAPSTLAGNSIQPDVATGLKLTVGNTALFVNANNDFIDVYLPGMVMASACIPTSPTQSLVLDTTLSNFSATAATAVYGLKLTNKIGTKDTYASPGLTWEWAVGCGMKAGAVTGSYTGYVVGRKADGTTQNAAKITYTVHADMTTVINYKGTAATKAVANTVETNTGTFTFTVNAAITAAAATKYNTMSIAATTSAKAGFNIGSGFSACTYTKNGAADTAYTYKTAVDADITAAKVIFRSAAAGGALAANDKIVVTCTNMKFLQTTTNAEWFTVSFMRDQTAATAGGEGVTASFTARGYPLLPQSDATQQVGKTDNAVKVMTKASSAALTSTATEGVIGAAEAGRWVNDTKDQVLEFSFTGLGTAITAGTAKTLTLTVPAAWVVDTANTITTSTISVGGTDKTSTYTWTATATTVVLTPKTATDGAIAADAAVVLRFGNMKRTGTPVASSAKETFTFASASEVNTSTFYLPLANGMGMTGSTMKASIGGKTLTGSITGFVTALTAGASNTATVTPDTTYAFTTTANDCTGSLPAGKAITSAQSATVATLTLAATAAYDTTASKTSVLDFSCKLATVPTTFATGKTVAVKRATEETGSYVISEDKGSSAASASSTVGVVLGAVFGVVGLAQLTL